MNVPGRFYVNGKLQTLLFDELRNYSRQSNNVAGFDMSDPQAVVSPGGVGFDINCGVRLLRTNLLFSDVEPVKERLAQALFDHIPVGVGSQGIIPTKASDLEEALQLGMDWSLRA